jgi:peptidoglycan-associated lipoprotein
MSYRASWYLLLAAFVTASACHARPPATTPVQTVPTPSTTTPSPPPPPPPPAPVAAPRSTPTPPSEADLFRRKSLAELNAERPLDDVYFDYDQNALKEDAKRVLQKDAQWLAKWPQTVIEVDGHCDERGSPEYNLALGERRAIAVREYLANLGIRSNRIHVRSLGKEVPFCRGEGEACWSQNRRGHFMITAR